MDLLKLKSQMSSFFRPRIKNKTKGKSKAKDNPKTNQSVIQIIKTIGERHGENSRGLDVRKLETDIKQLVSLMKRHQDDRHVQRVACHTISNMAIHQEKCPTLCGYNAHRSILKAVMGNIGDWKMCWLAMSAVWNLARPESCRKQFDPSSTLKLIYKVLNIHNTMHLVVETALGALSNLVLYEKIRSQCGRFHILQFLIEIIEQHTNHGNVATASAGLITNLAHSNEIASRLT
eukprot:899639_1